MRYYTFILEQDGGGSYEQFSTPAQSYREAEALMRATHPEEFLIAAFRTADRPEMMHLS